ncbi:hypothetical protein KNE206_22920 [Kitasatospora sp. NE20-6]|uniref:cell division protein PerM n=1 Tax=Kitasatospora sp. NE20-6 TaxID=2859066 RepID=UPI0034DC5E4A
MTQLMGRPLLGLPGDLGSRSVVVEVLTGARTALSALSVIAVPVLGLWVLTPYGDVTARGALRLSCAVWLLGHGAPLTRGAAGAPVTVTPLLLTAVSVLLLRRAGARAAARTPRGTGMPRALLPLGAGYLAVAALAAAECGRADAVLRADPLPGLVAAAVVVAASLGWGFCSVHGAPVPALPRTLAERFPAWAPPRGAAAAAGRTAAAWLAGLVAAAGTLLTAAVLAGDAGHSADGLADRVAGVLGLLLACTLLLPNALVWAAAFALGPGFAVGTGTAVSPFGTRLGALPEFPLFELVPGGPAGPGWELAVGLLPLAAGAVPALLLGRAAAGRTTGRVWRPGGTAVAALASALGAGAAAGTAAWLAGGALAPGRMSVLGPVAWQTALAAAGWCAAVVLPGALIARGLLLRTAGAGPDALGPRAAGPAPSAVTASGGRPWRGRGAAAVRLRTATAHLRAGLHAAVARLATAVPSWRRDPRSAGDAAED